MRALAADLQSASDLVELASQDKSVAILASKEASNKADLAASKADLAASKAEIARLSDKLAKIKPTVETDVIAPINFHHQQVQPDDLLDIDEGTPVKGTPVEDDDGTIGEGRRGAFLSTTGSFTLSSGNRAGNSERVLLGQEATAMSGTNTTCTAKLCPIDGYKGFSEKFALQLAVWIGQKKELGTNQLKIRSTLDHLVNGDNLISGENDAQPFQLNFDTNVGNKFKVTGCNKRTGEECSGTGTTCAVSVTIDFQTCPASHHDRDSCSKCTHGHALLATELQLLTDIPACETWFVKADAALRCMITSQRTFWLTDRINLCKNHDQEKSPPTPPSCTDTPHPGRRRAVTCAEQKSWGKCDVKANPWMAGNCCHSCFNCDPKCGK